MIVDEGECKKAVEFLRLIFRGNQISRRNPSGCYAYEDSSGYFNKHESGTGNAKVKSICKQGVYKFIHNQSSSNIHHFCNMCFSVDYIYDGYVINFSDDDDDDDDDEDSDGDGLPDDGKEF